MQTRSQSPGNYTGVMENPKGKTLAERFNPPAGYLRSELDSGSFGFYLRSRPLKPAGEYVRYFDGSKKSPQGVYAAVLDLPIGNRDLHQCADAVMRLRADYLFSRKEYERIHFNLTNGFRCDYSKWKQGFRLKVDGNKVSWVKRCGTSDSSSEYWKYLEAVFTYAGTLSLSKELHPIDCDRMRPGDVFIIGGSPGHAVIVVDMADHPGTGKKVFMLAQSYMPAQEIQILINPDHGTMSPWYELDFGEELRTPEWSFSRTDLKRFSN